VANVSVFAYHF